MINDHYQDVATNRAIFQRPELDFQHYMELQRRGELLFVAARLAPDNDLVGYVALLLKPHPHYRSVIMAVDDGHYLVPTLRNQGIGKTMLEFAEDAARQRGAQAFSMRDKVGHEHREMWESMGYALTDYVYVKDIRDEKAKLAMG